MDWPLKIQGRFLTELAVNEKTFNYLVKEYHYLSYGRPVGQNMKYFIIGANHHVLGCLLFEAAAWKSLDRDQWIGWTAEIREQTLGLICNNTRFLLLPWVNVLTGSEMVHGMHPTLSQNLIG